MTIHQVSGHLVVSLLTAENEHYWASITQAEDGWRFSVFVSSSIDDATHWRFTCACLPGQPTRQQIMRKAAQFFGWDWCDLSGQQPLPLPEKGLPS